MLFQLLLEEIAVEQMFAQELAVEETHWDVESVQSQELQVFFFRDVYFLQLITSFELCFKFLDEIITKRTVIVCVESNDW